MEPVLQEEISKVIFDSVEETQNNPPVPMSINTLATDCINNLFNSVKLTDCFKAIEILDTIKNRVVIIGDIDEETGDIVAGYIRLWNSYDEENNIPVEERKPIKCIINSNGGDLMSTFTAVDAIQNSITPVWTINGGKAYSGGFFIMLAGHKRYSYRHSSFLFHEGSTSNGGDANKFQNWADFYKTIRAQMKEFTLAKTRISEAEYDEHVKDDWWLMADKALEYGIIDDYAPQNWFCK